MDKNRQLHLCFQTLGTSEYTSSSFLTCVKRVITETDVIK